jgi:hypothetical protein
LKYIYHVCSKLENSLFDGIVTRDKPVITHEDYLEIKIGIRDHLKKSENFVAGKITITSLSLLHKEYPE